MNKFVIKVKRYESIYIIADDNDVIGANLLKHIYPGLTAFTIKDLERITFLAHAHNWELDVIPESDNNSEIAG